MLMLPSNWFVTKHTSIFMSDSIGRLFVDGGGRPQPSTSAGKRQSCLSVCLLVHHRPPTTPLHHKSGGKLVRYRQACEGERDWEHLSSYLNTWIELNSVTICVIANNIVNNNEQFIHQKMKSPPIAITSTYWFWINRANRSCVAPS